MVVDMVTLVSRNVTRLIGIVRIMYPSLRCVGKKPPVKPGLLSCQYCKCSFFLPELVSYPVRYTRSPGHALERTGLIHVGQPIRSPDGPLAR